MKASTIIGTIALGTMLAITQPNAQEKPKKLEEIVHSQGNPEKNFEKFLDQWSKEYSPKDASKENDTVKAVYELFQQLFTPFDLKGKASFDGGEGMNDGYKNVTIPGKYFFYICPTGRALFKI